MTDNEDFNAMEDDVFSAISPSDVHAIMADWGGTSYPLLIQALALLLRLQEAQKAAAKQLTLEEMATVRNVGTYTLQ